MKNLRIMVVDDHEVVRKGVSAILGARPGWEVCGEASTGREAVSAVARLKPDVVVMDLSMPDMDGLEATREILKEKSQVEVLILSMHDSEQILRDVLRSGARGYVLKNEAGSDLTAAVDALRQHKPYFAASVTELVLRGFLMHAEENGDPLAPGQLTPRQRKVLQLVAEGKSNKEVAATLNISIKTVETHRARVMAKLDLHSTTDLIRYAIRNNIVEC